MAGLSDLTVLWQTMQLADCGMPMVTPLPPPGWQVSHVILAPAWVLWLKEMGCSTGSGIVCAPARTDRSASAKKIRNCPCYHRSGRGFPEIGMPDAGWLELADEVHDGLHGFVGVLNKVGTAGMSFEADLAGVAVFLHGFEDREPVDVFFALH